MATVLTQDAVLHFLRSSGGSVKNSDLLAHFRSFIRDHADRDRNRELFKKFVNSVATVRQEDGVSLVVLRKQFRGGGGSANPPQVSAGRVTEASPQRTDPVPTAQKPRPKPQPGQSGTHAPAGETARRTVLPAAGITINNNNNVETSLNVKPPNSTSPLGVRSAAAPALNPVTDRTQTSSLSERPVQDQRPDGGQARSGLGPLHGITPVAPPVRPYGETRSPVPVVPVALPVRPQGQTRAQVPVVPVALPVRPQGQTRAQVPVVPVALPVRPQGQTRAQVPVVPVAPPVRPYGETRSPVPLVPVALPVRPQGQTRAQVPLVPGVPVIPVEPVTSVPPTHRGRQGRVQSEGGLLSSDSEIVPVRFRYRPSYKSAMSCDDDDDDEEEEEEEELPVRQRSGGAVWPASGPLTDTARIISTSSPCILDRPAPPPVSSSSSSSSAKQPPKIFIQDVEWEETQVPELLSSSEPGLEPVSGESASRRSRPSEAERYRPSPKPTPHQDPSAQPAAVQPPVEPRLQLSSSPSSSSSTSEARFSSDWPPSSSSQGRKDLQAQTAQTGQVPQIQDVLQRAQGAMLESVEHPASSKTAASPWQQSAGGLHDDQESAARVPRRSTAEAERVPQIQDVLQRAQGTKMEASAWPESAANLYDTQDVLHRSTGDLLDTRDEVESSDGSASTPRLRQRLALPRRLSREVRDRMCRSLGTDLDQIQDDVAGGSEAARLNRLHLISSSLSLRGNLSSSLSSCSTPPRCHSLLELDERAEQKGGRRSLPAAASANQQEAHGGHIRQSLVPLEPREHSWYVKAAAGAWPDIYSLFREDPSLLNKQDFISGFTVLHWIAKHGDHRVLNTLWYGVQKAGLAFTVDARSLCGYTPLHIAAIHSNKNIMRLLVKNFGADVKPRDMAGKRPWQYLGCAMTPDVFQLLGAPARAALQGTGISDLQQPQQSRRRRHHLSTASSGERPSIVAGVPKVKRSTSLAAFLKHKSLLPFHGQQSDAAL